jgi:hypothetical protein
MSTRRASLDSQRERDTAPRDTTCFEERQGLRIPVLHPVHPRV